MAGMVMNSLPETPDFCTGWQYL